MIIPILSGLIGWRQAPVTWALVILNFSVLGMTTLIGGEAQRRLEKVMNGDYFIGTQGRVYAQYVNEHPSGYPDFVRELGRQVADGQAQRLHLLGQLAFRDSGFQAQAAELQFEGDQVAFKLWKKKRADVEILQEVHPSFTLGLNADDDGIERWVTYIFVHSGLIHLTGNMLFLIIFGASLELLIGGLGLLVVFLLSGVFAAGVFALMTGVTSSPLVGASGAVSGVMALYCALSWRRPVRYFYWLFLPFRGFMGFVYMPAWIGLILWAVNDLSGYLGTLPEMGGVAYTAHLGGEMAGVLVALLLFGLRRIWPVEMYRPSLPKIPMWSLIPFLPPVRKT